MAAALPDRRNVTSHRRCPIHTAWLSKARLNRRVYTKYTAHYRNIQRFYNRRLIITMHWESFTCYITSWQPSTSSYIWKYEPKRTLSKLPTDECDTSKPPEVCQKTMPKNKSVINVRAVSVGIYDLLTSQVAYFPHLSQLLAHGS